MCEDDEELRDEIAVTVVHEIAHHFGIEERRPCTSSAGADRTHAPHTTTGHPVRRVARRGGRSLERVLALPVLEGPADEGRDREERADDEQPPADREAQEADRGGGAEEQRPPAVRAEEAVLALDLVDVTRAGRRTGRARGGGGSSRGTRRS